MSETELREPTTAAGDALLTDVIQDHEAPSYHVIERIRRGILAIEAEARALASIPAEPERADEVARLDAIVLAQVLAFLDGSPGFSPAFVTDAQTELARRIDAAYPLAVEIIARLASARDDTSEPLPPRNE